MATLSFTKNQKTEQFEATFEATGPFRVHIVSESFKNKIDLLVKTKGTNGYAWAMNNEEKRKHMNGNIFDESFDPGVCPVSVMIVASQQPKEASYVIATN